MRVVDIYLRQGRIFAVGKKGARGHFIPGGPPAIVDPTVEGVSDAIANALAVSVIPVELPPGPLNGMSELIAAAGAKSESAFYRGASLCSIREVDTCVELMVGFRSGAGWHLKVRQQMPRNVPLRDLAAATLAALQEVPTRPPVRVPKKLGSDS